ncbi:MAG: hypothetical protein ACOC1K_01990 [Nanoarchaeota archaeon]
MDVQKIEKMLKSYTYEQPKILQGKSICEFDKTNKAVQITNFYESDFSKIDTCRGLRTTLFFELKKEFPEYNIYRVTGTEPKFFFKSDNFRATHSFLLMSKSPMIGDTEIIGEMDVERLKFIKYFNPLLIDPSYKIIKPYAESNYDVESVVAPEIEETLNLTKNLQVVFNKKIKKDKKIKTKLRPLLIQDNHLISLAMELDKQNELNLKIGIQQEGEMYCSYDPTKIINDNYINENIKKYARAIKNIPCLNTTHAVRCYK